MTTLRSKRARKVRATDKAYNDEEIELIQRYLHRLRIPTLKEFLGERDEYVSGTKTVLVDRILAMVEERKASYSELVGYLDLVEPWRAQQVFMLGTPRLDLRPYRTKEAFGELLQKHDVTASTGLPLVLPEELTVSNVEHDGRRIRITAIERREGWLRDEDYDIEDEYETEEGDDIEYRAYVKRVTRGLIMFEWDVVENHAMMQITRLPSGEDYEEARARFAELIGEWLDVTAFPDISLPKAIKKLHMDEEHRRAANQQPALKSYGIEYAGQNGGRLAGMGATSDDSVAEDPALSSALQQFRMVSVGRRGNFYWHLDPLGGDYVGTTAHVIVFAATRRVTFPRDDMEEEVIRHVLADIRKASV